jgi:hypothetical protein
VPFGPIPVAISGKGVGDVASNGMVARSRGPPNPRRANHRTRSLIRSPVAAIIIALAAAALLLGLAILHSDNTGITSKSIMVVRYACMGCQGGPSYFLTMQGATTHYTNSRLCRQTQKGIATVVLPNRPSDAEAGGSGAAQEWRGQQGQRVPLGRPPRPTAAGSMSELHT